MANLFLQKLTLSRQTVLRIDTFSKIQKLGEIENQTAPQ